MRERDARVQAVTEPKKRTACETLSGLHLLLTYECNYECSHCFVWGGPSQTGTMTPEIIERILAEARALGSIEWIYFEGGEPFLYYDTLVRGVRRAAADGFRVGIVSNAYWASSDDEAEARLKPLAGLIDDLSVSSDAYHGSEDGESRAEVARRAARKLGMPVDFISVAAPEATDVAGAAGKLPAGESAVLFRGRAAEKLASKVEPKPWERFDRCPWEDLRTPERVHVDPFGNLHICQGISIGNLFERPLPEIMREYDADAHPIVGPLLSGGPAEIARRYGLPHEDGYADHCHLCYELRRALRGRF
ncbi:MAG TPA: radical SAM protein, partial [Rhodocyclaceae bacterium]